MSVHPPSLTNATPAGQVFVTFCIEVFFLQNFVNTFQCGLKLDKKQTLCLKTDLYFCLIFKVTIFYYYCRYLCSTVGVYTSNVSVIN